VSGRNRRHVDADVSRLAAEIDAMTRRLAAAAEEEGK
jgi:hypothetical protein